MFRYFGLCCVYLSDRRGQGISSCQDHLFLLWGLSPQLPRKGSKAKMRSVTQHVYTKLVNHCAKTMCSQPQEPFMDFSEKGSENALNC